MLNHSKSYLVTLSIQSRSETVLFVILFTDLKQAENLRDAQNNNDICNYTFSGNISCFLVESWICACWVAVMEGHLDYRVIIFCYSQLRFFC